MNKSTIILKKWTARAMVTIGTALGIASCCNNRPIVNPAEAVYGPPPGYSPISAPAHRVEVIEDVYGPPPVEYADTASARDEKPVFIEED